MVSPNKARFDLRETSPLPRNMLHSRDVRTLADTGQRTNPKLVFIAEGYRGWLGSHTSPKVSTGYLPYPVDVRDTAKSGMGRMGNRHLHHLAESISVNVGGSRQDAKASSLPTPDVSVGGSIVVRGWESQPQGEGSQEKDVPWYSLAATGSTTGRERERDDKAGGNPSGGMPISGEPDAMKVARPVRRGE
jgi:hypothetical protein